MFACDFARKAALKSAEKEFANYASKVFVKDLAAASAKGGLILYGVEKWEDNWVGFFHYYSPTYYNNPMFMSGTFPKNMKKTQRGKWRNEMIELFYLDLTIWIKELILCKGIKEVQKNKRGKNDVQQERLSLIADDKV